MTAPDIVRGARIGGFVVEALIGVGGMAKVYRARQPGVDRAVALKVLAPALATDPGFVRRFRSEAGVMRDLEHPAVLSVYAAGEDAGQLYLAMQLVPGRNLADLLAEGRMPWPTALAVLRAVGQALDHVHSRGIIHRDVKPANILLDTEGRPFLSDFGISKGLGVATTQTVGSLGTPRYMAPEQAAGGAVGHRGDLYSLACMAFEMLTGRVPYPETDTTRLLVAHASGTLPRPTDVDSALPLAADRVFARALAKRPGERFPSGQAFVDALTGAMATTKRRRALERRRPGRRTLVAVAVAALLIGGGMVVSTTVGERAADAFRPAPAELTAVPRGARIYEAPMNGTAAGFLNSSSTDSVIRYLPGASEHEVLVPGGETYAWLALDGPGVETFLAEMDVRVRPGSDVKVCLTVRQDPSGLGGNDMCVKTDRGTAAFRVFRSSGQQAQIGPAAELPDVAAGRPVRLAVVVRERQFSLYADGRLVLDVPAEDAGPSSDAAGAAAIGTNPVVGLRSRYHTGLVRFDGLRLFEIGPAT